MAHSGAVLEAEHEVRRLSVDVGVPYDVFRGRYEQAVPKVDEDALARMIKDEAGWDEMLRAASANTPHNFMIYWSLDVAPIMRLAGDRLRCVEYLMGDHTTAERMYRHDPAVMLYAPLRTAIHEDAEGTTWFSVDQPSAAFAAFDDPRITAVGVELDHKLAALLEHLDVPVPERLVSG
ncbi:DUF302 domain-containing protein [Sphaerisporangium aureirubrum]|uniref:DUF302 domain-containing protein n=1 Tax=Sphaerisporangium aureirubrum TaxID=1544736 RepID=A0ABW1NRF3_9ACTN